MDGKRAIQSPWREWLFVFSFFLVLYAMTANRGVQWQDSGSHLLRILTGEIINLRGLALSHPLHYWLGRAALAVGTFPPAYAITLVSCVAAALAVANTFGCVWSLTGKLWASLYACCSLGVAHTFWQMATVTETYTLVAALLSAETWALILFLKRPARSYLWLALACGGLGLANHNLGALTLPVVAVLAWRAVRRRQISGRDLGIGVVFWLLGSLSYTALVISEVGRSGDLAATISSAMFGKIHRGDVLNVSISARTSLINATFAILNFPGLLIPFALAGVLHRPVGEGERLARRALIAGLMIHGVFAVRYPVVDQHTFFIPTYVFVAIFGGVGMSLAAGVDCPVARRVRRAGWVLLLLTPLLYAAVPGVARRMGVLDAYARHKPYRDDYTYVFAPWSVVETSAARMSERALSLAGDRGLIFVADVMAQPAIRFTLQSRPQRDVSIADQWDPGLFSSARAEGRTVVFVPSDTREPPPAIVGERWRREGDLFVYENDPWRLREPRTPASANFRRSGISRGFFGTRTYGSRGRVSSSGTPATRRSIRKLFT